MTDIVAVALRVLDADTVGVAVPDGVGVTDEDSDGVWDTVLELL